MIKTLQHTGQPLHQRTVCSAAQSCPTLCDPIDCSPPGSSVQGISQARKLEWVAFSFIFLTQGSSPHLRHWQVASLALSHLGSLPDIKELSRAKCP